MKWLNRLLTQRNCHHHFLVQYDMFMIGGYDLVRVHKCCKCGKKHYKNFKRMKK